MLAAPQTVPDLDFQEIQIVLDFETYYDQSYSLSKMTTMEYVADPRFKVWGVGVKIDQDPTEYYTADEIPSLFDSIDWSICNLICHNTLFDGYILAEVYNIFPGFYSDTAAMARGLDPHKSASLAATAERMFPNDLTMRKGTELVMAKGVVDLPPGLETDIARYCIQDVDLTYAIYAKIAQSYPASERDIIDLTTRLFCDSPLELDVDFVEQLITENETNVDSLIENSGLTRAQLNSSAKFSAHIESLGLTVPVKRSDTTGKMIPALAKNDSGWKQLVTMYPEHNNLWDARTAVKSVVDNTRGQRFLTSVTKRGMLPIPLKYYAAHTGRFGGTEKINLHNLPRDSKLRHCLRAPKDSLVFAIDLSNIESRVLAYVAGEAVLLDAYKNGEDIYCSFASKIYQKTIPKPLKDGTPYLYDTERFVGKTAVLGLGYGMGAQKFFDTLKSGGRTNDVDLGFAQDIVNLYRSNYPSIQGYWKLCSRMLFAMLDRNQQGVSFGPITIGDRQLILPNGMSMKYPNLEYDPNFRQFSYESYKGGRLRVEKIYGGKLAENIVQALSRIILTDAMLMIDLEEHADVAHNIHDEILVVAPANRKKETEDMLMSWMTYPPKWAPGLPLDAECKTAQHYSK